MSSKVIKSRVAKSSSRRVLDPSLGPAQKTLERNELLRSIAENCFEMPSCSSCEARGIDSCEVSPKDSSRCMECVRLGVSFCDVLGPSPADLRNIAKQRQRLEEQLEAAEEERRAIDNKIERLRKQKKEWVSKMRRAIRRGLDSVEELDRVENAEAEAERKRIADQSAEVVRRSSSEEAGGMVAQEAWLRAEGEVGVFDWSSMANDVGDWSTFLDVPGVGGDVAAGGPSKS